MPLRSVGLSFIPCILTKIYSRWVSATYPFASVGRDVSVHYTCEVGRRVARRIEIGNSVTIGKHAWILSTVAADGAKEPCLIIGDNCLIDRFSQILARNYVQLERDVMVSSSVLIADHLHAYEDVTVPIRNQGATQGGRIYIRQGCWIGRGAAIVCDHGELELGCHCVVAANSLVTRSFPAYSVIAGNPARVVKQYDPVKKVWVLGSSRAAELASIKQEQATVSV